MKFGLLGSLLLSSSINATMNLANTAYGRKHGGGRFKAIAKDERERRNKRKKIAKASKKKNRR